MSIQKYKDGIKKDHNIVDKYKTYLGNGQGCETVWFSSVPAARKALKQNGIKTGRDLFNCKECACHYSCFNEEHLKYPEYACSDAKKQYAKQFDINKG
jgi:hypothetical protein